MIKPADTLSSALTSGPVALHELGRALRQVGDFQRFVHMLESTIAKSGLFSGISLRLHEEAPPPEVFSAGQMTLPIAGAEGLHGVLRLAPAEKDHLFGAEDLHLMSGLAAVLAAALDHARHHGEVSRLGEGLAFLCNLAPVGLLMCDDSGRVMIANDLACRWLGVETGDLAAVSAALAPETLGTEWRAESRFYLRTDGRLVFGERRTHRNAESDTASHAFVLSDLSGEQGRLLEGLQRELYRSRWLARPLSFILLELPKLNGGLLQRLPDLRANLEAGELIGPYDAMRIGWVLPETDRAAAAARLRALRTLLPGEGVNGVLLEATEEKADALISRALAGMQPLNLLTRRSLLLHDDYAAVNDMIELVLGRDYRIVKSNTLETTLDLLAKEPFDGFFTEVELRGEFGGVELAREAKRRQPSIRPFFTTVSRQSRLEDLGPELADHRVVRKPFDVKTLAETVRAALS